MCYAHPRQHAAAARRVPNNGRPAAISREIMSKPLRYTGCWPPPDVLAQYPNWIYALDEEGEEDQDETTIKPEDQQHYISERTCFTAADIVLAGGVVKTGFITVDEIVPCAIDVFDGQEWWSVGKGNGRRWETGTQSWLPTEEGRPTVSLDDRRIFPLVAKSRLQKIDGEPMTISVSADGKAKVE
jgi:hypothetical protein